MSERNEEMTAFLLAQKIASDPEMLAEWNRRKAQEAKNGAIAIFVLGAIGVFVKGGWETLGLMAMAASGVFYALYSIKTFFSR
jgi:hypothetical protein